MSDKEQILLIFLSEFKAIIKQRICNIEMYLAQELLRKQNQAMAQKVLRRKRKFRRKEFSGQLLKVGNDHKDQIPIIKREVAEEFKLCMTNN